MWGNWINLSGKLQIYWKQEKEKKKREKHFTYKEPKQSLFDAIYKLIHLIEGKKLISQNMVENYIIKNYGTKEALLENKWISGWEGANKFSSGAIKSCTDLIIAIYETFCIPATSWL